MIIENFNEKLISSSEILNYNWIFCPNSLNIIKCMFILLTSFINFKLLWP
jgi:hypothetical protein